jgi:hypothetical protein
LGGLDSGEGWSGHDRVIRPQREWAVANGEKDEANS